MSSSYGNTPIRADLVTEEQKTFDFLRDQDEMFQKRRQIEALIRDGVISADKGQDLINSLTKSKKVKT